MVSEAAVTGARVTPAPVPARPAPPVPERFDPPVPVLRPGRASGSRAVLPMWPLTTMFALMPLWFLLGAWYLIWPLFGLLLATLLLLRGAVRLPTGTTCWLIFLGIAAVSATRLDKPTALLTFGLRFGHLLTAFLVGVYVYNMARQQTSWHRIAGPLCIFWLSMVVLGWSGVLAPKFGIASPVEILLPGSMSKERFILDITHLDTTEYNALGNNPIYRPAAPYPYTNNWGTAYSFLVPFVLAYVTSVRRGTMRTVLLVSLPLSLIPAFYTLNRGMFIGLGAGLVYLLGREVAKGRVRLVVPVVALVLLAWLVTLFIPVTELISNRTSTTDTTSDRLDLYVQTWNAVVTSPLLGFGQPASVDTTHASEPLGTQGMVWQVLFSHGIPALICVYVLFGLIARRLAAAVSPAGLWLSTLPVIAVVVTPFYSYIDPNMSVLFFAVGLGLAAVDGPVNRDRKGVVR